MGQAQEHSSKTSFAIWGEAKVQADVPRVIIVYA